MSYAHKSTRLVALLLVTLAVAWLTSAATALGASAHASRPFKGVKVNGGTVTHSIENNRDVLTLSDDFVVPQAPAPHWQIVDSGGNTYLLQRLDIKDGKFNRRILVPDYITDLAKVRIWCAFAETLLGETAFDSVITLNSGMKSTTSSGFMGVKANTGSVTHTHQNGRRALTLSDDFKIPDAPAPHWQIVDSVGRTYLLQRLAIRDGRKNRTIEVPGYVPDIATVQIWCAYAEVLLGEAKFNAPVR